MHLVHCRPIVDERLHYTTAIKDCECEGSGSGLDLHSVMDLAEEMLIVFFVNLCVCV